MQTEQNFKLTKTQIEKSIKSLLQGREPLPIQKDKIPQKWEVRFKYIQCQQYCPVCDKWNLDASYDYCLECGFDYYSHVDLKDNQIAPIRRGWCYVCRINLSLNQQQRCQACYYQSVKNTQKAQQINALRLKAKQQAESGDIYKEILRIKQVRRQIYLTKMVLSGGFDYCPENFEQQMRNKITQEMILWEENPNILVNLNQNLWRQFIQKGKQLYKSYGICY